MKTVGHKYQGELLKSYDNNSTYYSREMLNGLTASGDNMWLRRWDTAQRSLRDGSVLRSLNLGLCSVYVIHVSKGAYHWYLQSHFN